MRQQKKSEKSRAAILDAALTLFSHQGYRGTSIRDIAEKAGVSTGNVYHHFPDKETIFETLLSQYWKAIERPDFPFNRALASGSFPDNLEKLAEAAEQSVRTYRPYVALIYVDVVELSGQHIRKFYSEMSGRFDAFIRSRVGEEMLAGRMRPGISPLSAVMLASRFFLHYFAVEILFGVPNQFGKDSRLAIREIAEILRHGMLRGAAHEQAPPARAALRRA
ncbi:MAG: TetR/AcrR family transcriptional regulator [Thermoanaerobaculia bacterium]